MNHKSSAGLITDSVVKNEKILEFLNSLQQP